MANQIQFQVGYNVDKTGLNELKTSLQEIQQQASQAKATGGLTNELKTAAQSAQQLENILNSAWNSKLQQLDLSKVNTGIKNTYGSVSQLKTSLEASGTVGATAYNKVASAVLNTNLQLKQSNKLLDNMAITMANTVKWGITSSIFNNITSSIQQAYYYTKDLDTSLNDIRIVTDKSSESMQQFAREANSAAKALGASTLDYTDASLIYYQQGLSDADVKARSEVTLKAANVTAQSGQEVSEQLTAVWNGYKVTADEAELYVDKLAAVAASTAADLEELSTGMSKVASAANAMGVDVDQLNAQLATIVSVTRQAPESVGTALKTIYARMGDLSIDGEDEFGTTLGDVTSKMEAMGIQVLDETGDLREMGVVIEEVAEKWDTWTGAQQQAAAVALAGKRQYNNLVALFENWDMYTEALETSATAAGTLQEQQDIYMESTRAHLQQLSTEAERTYDILFDTDTVNGFADSMTGLLNIFNNYLTGLDGGINSIVHMGSVVANVFSNQIGRAISNSLTNIDAYRANLDAIAVKQQVIDAHAAQGQNVTNESAVEKEAQIAQQLLQVRTALTSEQYNQLTAEQQRIGLIEQEIQEIQSYQEVATQILNKENATNAEFVERIGYEEEQLKYLEKQEQKLIQAVRLYSELADADKASIAGQEERQNLAEILEEYNKTTIEDSDEYVNINAMIGSLLDSEVVKTTEIDTVLQSQNLKVENQRGLVNQVTQALENKKRAEDGTLINLQQEQDARQKIIAQTTQQAERQQLLSQAVSGMMTLVSLFTTLNGIIQTLNNEDLSAGEKAQAIITTLLMTTPMLIMNFKNLGAIAPGLATGMYSIANGLGSAAASEAIAIGATTSLTGAVTTLWGALVPFLPIILGITAAVGVLAGAIYLGVKAYNADADAAREAAKASEEAADAADKAKNAYEELANAFDGYNKGIEALSELTKGTEEYEDALKKANEQAMEMIKSNSSLAKYASRNSEGLITFDKEARGELAKAQNRANLAAGAADLAQIQANEAQLKSDRTNLKRAENIGYMQSMEGSYAEGPSSGEYFVQISDAQIQDVISLIQENNGTLLKEDLEQLESLNNNEDLIDSIMNAEEGLIALANATSDLDATNKMLLGNALREGLSATNETYAGMDTVEQNAVASIYEKGLTDEIGDSIRSTVHDELWQDAAMGRGNEDKIQRMYAEAMGYTLSKDKSGDKAVYVDEEGKEVTVDDDTARTYLENLQTAEQIARYNEASLENITNAVGKISDVGEDIQKGFSSELLGFASKEDMTFDASSMSLETIRQLQEDLGSGKLQEALSTVTNEEWAALGYSGAEAFTNALETSINDEEFLNAAIDSAKGKVLELSDSFDSLVEEMQAGNLTSENIFDNDAYKAIAERLETIKDLYPELTAAVETFSNTNLIGTEAWTQSLFELESALDDLQTTELQENLSTQLDEAFGEERTIDVDAWLNSDEFETQLDNILDADYAIGIEIHSQAEEAFESISNAMDNVEEAASKIGEDFVVAADDVRELNNVFPGILQNVVDLHDGTVQLNEDTVKAAVAAAESEIAADATKTNEKLKNAATELRAKQALYQSMADAAMVLASGEMDADKTAADYEKIIQEGLSKLDEEASTVKMENDELVTTNSQENAGRMATNWSQAYQEAAQSAAKFADAAVQAAQVAAAGEGSVSVPDFGIEYTGQAGVSSEASQIQQYQDLFESGEANYAKLAQSFQEAADLFGSQANDIEGMMVEAGAKLDESFQGLGNVAAGKGYETGKGSKKDKQDLMEFLEDELDIYHDINNEITKYQNNLSILQKQQDDLAGQDLIDNLNAQLDSLNGQVDAYQRKLALQKQDLANMQAQLAAQGVMFNGDDIANYNAIIAAKTAEVNSLISIYNSLTGEVQEEYKKKVELAKQELEGLTSMMEKYEDLLYNQMQDTQEQLQDLADEIYEINLQKFTMEIELRLDVTDATRTFNEFKRKVIDQIKDDDILGNAKSTLQDFFTYYNDANTGDVQTLTKMVNNTLAELQKGDNGLFAGHEQEGLDLLNEYNEKLMSAMEDVEDLVQEIRDAYLDMIDEVSEGLDDHIAKYEHIDNILEHNANLIQLLYGDDAYKLMDEYYAAQEKNNNANLDFQRQEVAFWKQQMDMAEEGSEEWKKFYENYTEAQESLNTLIEDSLELLIEKYQNAVKGIMDTLNKEVTGGLGLDYLGEEWELINKYSDTYLDKVEQIYEAQSLANKITQSINDTDDLKAQQKLKDLLDSQVALLREKDKLTQYDVDRANQLYELTLKEIALEEAQNSKTSMRLSRDSQGNWSYNYVADEESVASKQQELLDAQNSLYELDKNKYQENLNEIYTMYNEWQQKIIDLYSDTTLSAEELEAKKQLYAEQYGEQINALVAQNEEIKQNLTSSSFGLLGELYQQDIANMTAMGEEEIAYILGMTETFKGSYLELEEYIKQNYDNIKDKTSDIVGQIVPEWTSGVQQMADKFANGEDSFKGVCEKAYADLDAATKNYQMSLDNLQAAAGVDFSNISTYIQMATQATANLYNANAALIQSYNAELAAMQSVIATLNSLISQYNAARDAAIAAANAAYAYYAAVTGANADAAANAGYGGSGGGGASGSGGGSDSSGGAGGGSGSGSSGAGGGAYKLTGGLFYYDSYGTNPSGNHKGQWNGTTVYITNRNDKTGQVHISTGPSLGQGDLGWLDPNQLQKLKSGGYTGDWGSEDGKVAMLHEKELVLNKDDTKNILSAVGMVRGISHILEALNSSLNSNITSRMSGMNSSVYNTYTTDNSGDTLAQDVTIHAEFPNVTQSSEIEAALNNLVNRATQHANSTKK